MNLYIGNKKINSVKISRPDMPSAKSAAVYLYQYVEKLGFDIAGSPDLDIQLVLDEKLGDNFSIKLTQNELTLCGGVRGIIYSVFSFLETLGCRFFTPTIETLPKGDVYLDEFEREEATPFEFRDVLTNQANGKYWSLKQKLNSNWFNVRKFTVDEGGSFNTAGIPAHTLCGEFLLKPYVETNPEYFSLVNGVRHTDRMGQICMTNEDAMKAAAYEACKVLDAHPDCNIVSVSQGDNNNFCRCESCQKLIDEQGLMKTYLGVISTIAALIKEKHPEALVHTLAYEDLCQSVDFELEDNIMLQYCFGKCHMHAIDDENCSINKKSREQLINITKNCKHVHIWNYVNCFKYEMFEFPFIHNFRRNIRFFADAGATGVFNEGFHRTAEETDFSNTMELRSYVLAKLLWNPYMSEEEFRGHIDEFCHAFYGEGAKFIIEYLSLFETMHGDEHSTYDLGVWPKVTDNYEVAHSIKEEKIPEFISSAYDLLDKADALATDEQKVRIDKLRTTVLYFEMYYTMDDILEHGTDDEKKLVLAKNSDLIDRIIDKHFVVTFWGQWRRTQNEELETFREKSPKHWNYRWG